MTLNVVFDLSPSLKALLETSILSLYEDLKARLDDLKAAAATEHEQVLAAIEALEARVGETLNPPQVAAISALFDEARAAIAGVYEPPPA